MLRNMPLLLLCTCAMIITRLEFVLAAMNTTGDIIGPAMYSSSESDYSSYYQNGSEMDFDLYDDHSTSDLKLLILNPSVRFHEMISVSLVNATFEPYDYAFLIRLSSEKQCEQVIRVNDTNCTFNLKNWGWYTRLFIRSSATRDLTMDNINTEIINDNISRIADVSDNECLDWSMQGECRGNRVYHTYMICRPVGESSIPYWSPEYLPHKTAFDCLLGCSANCTCYLRDGVLATLCANNTKYTTAIVWNAPGLQGYLAIRLKGNLNLGKNAFSSYHFRGEVTELHLSSDQSLRTIDNDAFSGFGNLSYLSLGYNGIQDLKNCTFNFLMKLRYLELSWNEIKNIEVEAFASLNGLEHLQLKQNQIKRLRRGLFRCLRSLQNLFLNNNLIKDVAPGLFSGLFSLQTLDLSYNYIHSLKAKVFNELIGLQFLYLHGNDLRYLSEGAFLRHVTFFDGRNPFLCNTNKVEDRRPPIDDVSHNVSLAISNYNLQLVKLDENRIADFTFDSFQGLKNVTVEVDHDWLCCFLKQSHCVVPTRVREKTNFLTCNRLLPNTIAKVLLWIFGCFAVIGNINVIFWQLRLKANKKVQPLLIANLAISDLLMGMYMLIIASADVYYGDYFPAKTENWRNGNTCLAAGTLSMISSETSILLVTLISLDRLMGIRFTFSQFRLHIKGAFIAVLVMWAVSCTLGLLPVFANLSTLNYELSEVCVALPLSMKISYKVAGMSAVSSSAVQFTYTVSKSEMYYSIAVFIGLNSLCCLIIAFCYIWIFVTVKTTASHAGRHRAKQEEIRMAMKMSVIVLTDFCCWVPVIIMGIMVQAGIKEIPPVANAWIVTLLMPINSAINPFLYTLATVMAERYHKTRTKWRLRHSQIQKHTHELHVSSISSANHE